MERQGEREREEGKVERKKRRKNTLPYLIS